MIEKGAVIQAYVEKNNGKRSKNSGQFAMKYHNDQQPKLELVQKTNGSKGANHQITRKDSHHE